MGSLEHQLQALLELMLQPAPGFQIPAREMYPQFSLPWWEGVRGRGNFAALVMTGGEGWERMFNSGCLVLVNEAVTGEENAGFGCSSQ